MKTAAAAAIQASFSVVGSTENVISMRCEWVSCSGSRSAAAAELLKLSSITQLLIVQERERELEWGRSCCTSSSFPFQLGSLLQSCRMGQFFVVDLLARLSLLFSHSPHLHWLTLVDGQFVCTLTPPPPPPDSLSFVSYTFVLLSLVPFMLCRPGTDVCCCVCQCTHKHIGKKVFL